MKGGEQIYSFQGIQGLFILPVLQVFESAFNNFSMFLSTLFSPLLPWLSCSLAKKGLEHSELGRIKGEAKGGAYMHGGGREGKGAHIMPGDSTGVIRANKLSAWASDGLYCSYLDGGTMAGCQAPIVHNLLMLTKCQCDPWAQRLQNPKAIPRRNAMGESTNGTASAGL